MNLAQLSFKIILAVVCALLLFIIFRPFFSILFMTSLLSIIFYPVFRRLEKKLSGRKYLAAILTLAVIAVVLALPLAVVTYLLSRELSDLFENINRAMKSGEIQVYFDQIKKIPILPRVIELSGGAAMNIDVPKFLAAHIQELSGFVLDQTTRIAKGFSKFVFGLIVTLFATYYFLKDGESIKKTLRDFLPVPKYDRDTFFSRLEEMIKATIYGGVVIAVVQGFLGGLAFWMLGIPSPLVWGTVMVLCAFIPFGGTGLVWVPGAVYLILIGSYIKGIILVIYGIMIIGTIDNLMRPYLMSSRTNIHPLLLFFSVIGGISAFGIIGIFAGPLIMALAIAFYELYVQRE